MSNQIRWIAFGCCLVGLSGCQSMQPNWLYPGRHEVQRGNAVQYDPYPDNSAGPEMTGVRPPDFQKPTAEPVRNQPFANPRLNSYPSYPQ